MKKAYEMRESYTVGIMATKETPMKTLRQKLEILPASRRKKIARRTEHLATEELTMRELRQPHTTLEA
ncbi:MAG: hypothetical protein WAM56_18045 [Acidobacteriaceae bacterium]